MRPKPKISARRAEGAMLLSPGDRHPNVPCAAEELARRLAVGPAEFAAWLDDGMPALPDGRLDPYAVTNWLSWGRLDRCPALARRWRSWLRWFSTVGQPCRLDVRRAQTCFLPEVRGLRWRVPEPVDAPGQHVLGRIWSEGEPDGESRLITRAPALRHEWQCQDEIALQPVEVAVGDRPVFEGLLDAVAGSFAYAYRQHLPDDTGDDARDGGTCLDLALRCGAELARAGRRWRLVSGVVAHRALANVHFWIEAEDTGGAWIPIDPTIPAVARMLGADWRALIPLAVGRHDARRIRIAHHEGPMKKTLGGIAGLVDADGDEALFCTDWAIGECAWSVAAA